MQSEDYQILSSFNQTFDENASRPFKQFAMLQRQLIIFILIQQCKNQFLFSNGIIFSHAQFHHSQEKKME